MNGGDTSVASLFQDEVRAICGLDRRLGQVGAGTPDGCSYTCPTFPQSLSLDHRYVKSIWNRYLDASLPARRHQQGLATL